jgi:hypothetical protein
VAAEAAAARTLGGTGGSGGAAENTAETAGWPGIPAVAAAAGARDWAAPFYADHSEVICIFRDAYVGNTAVKGAGGEGTTATGWPASASGGEIFGVESSGSLTAVTFNRQCGGPLRTITTSFTLRDS